MDEAFQVGDVVKLRSGGPRMTITSVGDNYGTPTAWVSWFEGTKPMNGNFPIGALLKIALD